MKLDMNTISFDFPPFVGAQIKNRTAQGKVTRKLKVKKKDDITQHIQLKNMPLWLRHIQLKICLYGNDDNILVLQLISIGSVTIRT